MIKKKIILIIDQINLIKLFLFTSKVTSNNPKTAIILQFYSISLIIFLLD